MAVRVQVSFSAPNYRLGSVINRTPKQKRAWCEHMLNKALIIDFFDLKIIDNHFLAGNESKKYISVGKGYLYVDGENPSPTCHLIKWAIVIIVEKLKNKYKI